MISRRVVAIALSFTLLTAAGWAQSQADAARAFDQYEAIRMVLAGDRIDGIAKPAAALTPLLTRLGTDSAVKTAATRLQNVKTLKEARAEFATLSKALVPMFLDAKIPGVEGYMCSMAAGPWAQRGDAIQNPYFGKVMLDCGEKIARQAR